MGSSKAMFIQKCMVVKDSLYHSSLVHLWMLNDVDAIERFRGIAMTFREWLVIQSVCDKAIRWVGNKTLVQAWGKCNNGAYLMWLMWIVSQRKYHDLEKKLNAENTEVSCCDCKYCLTKKQNKILAKRIKEIYPNPPKIKGVK